HQWMLSNSDVKVGNPDNHFFDDLYKEYYIERVPAKRNINSNGQKRGILTELLITNYRK
ncbi:MAG TPA: modification methylase, partial [Marinilabiliales bacterium]|nr:modification methylase [Marinilabiliales bacterium]